MKSPEDREEEELDRLSATFHRQKAFRQGLLAGSAFLSDVGAQTPPIWGAGDEALWSAGEALMIVGPTGVGKTTLALQIAAARCGLLPDVFGYQVQPASQRVLYLACDRPSQIARAAKRLLGRFDPAVVDARLWFWPGRLPADIGRKPDALVDFVTSADVDTVFVDSLKDVAMNLTNDDVGRTVNDGFRLCLKEGIEVCAVHHEQKKGVAGDLNAAYGSAWLTAGAGSVIQLAGSPGARLVQLNHLKQPISIVGPLFLEHDKGAGVFVETWQR